MAGRSELTQDELRNALAYLRAYHRHDAEAQAALTNHTDPTTLIESLAWLACAMTVQPQQKSQELAFDRLFAYLDDALVD